MLMSPGGLIRRLGTVSVSQHVNSLNHLANMSTASSSPPPPISHILETCLYVRDIDESTKFYRSALNMEPFASSPRMTGFNLGSTTLLLFKLGLTQKDITVNSEHAHGLIPRHGPQDAASSSSSGVLTQALQRNSLHQHFCLAVQSPQDVEKWQTHFENSGVRVLGTMDWELGGKSVYFEDPDGHVGEIGSRGIWKHY